MIIQGNAIHIPLADNIIDCLVTDPPYGYAFMNKDWDKAVVGVETWKECLRVLKPGAFAFIMSSPRQDVLSRMIVNIQDAGFRTDFTSIYWTYASGFPKAKNLKDGSYTGFQPKPAVEVILVVMKPLSEKSFTDQALANGKGVTWLDNCRIPYQSEDDKNAGWHKGDYGFGFREWSERHGYDHVKKELESGNLADQKSRFPANLLVSDFALGCDYSRYFSLDQWFDTTFPFLIVPKTSKSERNMGLITSYMSNEIKWDNEINENGAKGKRFAGHGDVISKFPRYRTDQKPVLNKANDGRKTEIDNPFQRGETPRVNQHPTVKPIKLMSYLIMLGSRPNDLILDPFAGSGTTCIAAKQLNRRYLGIEIDHQYVEIAKARILRNTVPKIYRA